MTRLHLEKLAFGYGDRCVGSGLSFDIAGGEVICLLGPNGSGKTTLFKTLLGLLPPLGGWVTLDGDRVSGWSRRRYARSMAYVPQDHPGYFPYSAFETVLMGRSAHIGLFTQPTARDHTQAHDCLETLGIGHLAEQPFTQLSGGQRQLVLIARALAQEPRVLVMDEPTASLDFGNRLRVLDQARRLADAGIAVILSTHDPDQAFQIADRVALLHRGRLVGMGPPDNVITADNLRSIYEVDVSVVGISQDCRQHWVCLPARKPNREEAPSCGRSTMT